jgi:hypothetical protein
MWLPMFIAFSSPSAGSQWVAPDGPSRGVAECGAAPLHALQASELAGRYARWQGASGLRYLFSVYAPETCPAYCDAILAVAGYDALGRRTILSIEDTGEFPEPALARATTLAAMSGGRVEFHLHLLAATRGARRSAIGDLAGQAASTRN